ncbi:MAG: hypothetical protein HFI70_06675 [Lachnospiraceae bacterium]|nr:hypothetical protein [Lachnospiraceae bacterium]
MLKKLLKHEWKSVGKILLPINLGIILLTIIGCIILSTDTFETEESLPLALLLFLFYTLSIMTFSGVTIIYIYVHFYKNLFTVEGYLWHTLPVTRTQLFHSRLLIGSFWCSLNSFLTVLSAAALGFTAGFHAATEEKMDSLQSLLMDGSLSKSADGTTVDFVFSDIFGYSPVIFIILLLLVLLTSCISSVLMGYLSTLLGQLVEKYRLAASIGFYMAIYMITQTITSLVMIAPNIHMILSSDDETSTYFISNFFGSMFPAAIISQIILIVIFYTASLLLIRRQPNLE